METSNKPNKLYLITVSVLSYFLPTIGFVAEHFARGLAFTFDLFSKWFIFSAVGLRLFLAGIKQVKDPAFTAKQIFHIEGSESYVILRD